MDALVHMLYTNVTVDEKLQPFAASRKPNHSGTAPSSQVLLGYDILQCQKHTTTHIIRNKKSILKGVSFFSN